MQHHTNYYAGPGVKRRKKPRKQALLAETKHDKQKEKAAEGDENEDHDDAMIKEFEGVPRSSKQIYEKFTLLQIL